MRRSSSLACSTGRPATVSLLPPPPRGKTDAPGAPVPSRRRRTQNVKRSGCCRSAVRCAGRGAGRRDLVPALCELLDDLRAESLQVVGLAARDQALIDDDLLVDPVTTGVADVRFERGP